MPWKDGTKMDERLRFVARRLEGESMSDLCREFGISRKTGHKIFNRYKEEGVISLCDRSRRPVRYANQLPGQIEQAIVRAKQDKPSWGARKIRELLVRRLAGDVRTPAISTIHAVLDRHGDAAQTVAAQIAQGGGRAIAIAADVTDHAAIAAAAARVQAEWGACRVLVNNAALVGYAGPLLSADLEQWNRTLAVNLTGTWLGIQAVLPGMLEREKK